LSAAGHDVHLYEANNYVGGHTDTHHVQVQGKDWSVDTGFIVFNEDNYPNFSRFLQELKVPSQISDMSFGVHNAGTGLEYNATSIDTLFCQRRNILNPSFYRMLWDLVRFYRQSHKLLEDTNQQDSEQTLGDYLKSNNYSRSFIQDHILPMACALWSGPSISIEDFPVNYFVSFMQNHKMLTLTGRPEWRVVKSGSRAYVDAMLSAFQGSVKTSTPVREIKRHANGVSIRVDGGCVDFNKVVIATHSDQALSMLSDPSQEELDILSGIKYQRNEMQLHSDTSVMPKNRKAWASWNVKVGNELESACTVSYYMNLLQNLGAPVDFFTSLNCSHLVDSAKVYVSRSYDHPVYNASTLRSQQRRQEISGPNNTYYCGAYWGWGFHEDGARTAIDCVKQIQAEKEVSQAASHAA
jgi:hypothetical protein